MRTEVMLTVLFCVATAVAMLVRRFKVPYTVALVGAGLSLGVLHLPAPHLTKDLLYAVFLPGLIFEASFHLPYRSFRQNRWPILALAVPGVVLGIGVTALVLRPFSGTMPLLEGFTLRDTLLFGALLAATDPIAVVGLFKSLGAPKRLAVLVEGESLLNDGTGVVAYTLLLSALAGGGFSLVSSLVDFVRIVGMGLLIGLAIGLVVTKVIQAVDDPMIEITLTTIAAYGSFIAAEAFHFSGVIATVVAGMLCGNYAAHTGMSPTTRVAVGTFWEYVAFALNSLVFLLIGLQVDAASLLHAALPILLAFGTVTLARITVVSLSVGGLSLLGEKIPWRWAPVLAWGGLRGGLSMVLVLALPLDFPHREPLVTLTFGVVVLSIVGQGLTMAPLLRRLGLVRARSEIAHYEVLLGELQAVGGARQALHELRGRCPPDVVTTLQREIDSRSAQLEHEIEALHLVQGELRQERERAARRQLLLAERDALQESMHQGVIGAEAHEKLIASVDARLLELDDHG